MYQEVNLQIGQHYFHLPADVQGAQGVSRAQHKEHEEAEEEQPLQKKKNNNK